MYATITNGVIKSRECSNLLWNQVGLIYKSAHQFKVAGGYFEKSLQYDPKNLAVRADYASCLYYTGDVDGALAQLNQSLTYDPKHAGTLLNIGIIKWRGKNDADGAVAAWEKLLQYHPDFPHKDLVQQMLTQAKQGVKAASDGQKGVALPQSSPLTPSYPRSMFFLPRKQSFPYLTAE